MNNNNNNANSNKKIGRPLGVRNKEGHSAGGSIYRGVSKAGQDPKQPKITSFFKKPVFYIYFVFISIYC